MATYRRGRFYWYSFVFDGQHVQESTKQTRRNVAESMERAHRVRLAKERDERESKAVQLGCPISRIARCPECDKWFDINRTVKTRDSKCVCSEACRASWDKKSSPVPTLEQFCRERIEPWTKAQYERTSPNTWLWYRAGLRAIYEYLQLAQMKLDEITSESASDFAAHRNTVGRKPKAAAKKTTPRAPLQVNSINASLRVLRRILRLAVEWGIIENAPKIKLLRGGAHRERVITPQEEAKYLTVVSEPLRTIATVLADTGLRPDECYSLHWEHVHFENGRFGMLLVTHGKTPAARRMLPLTPRVRATLEAQHEHLGKPEEGWVFPAPTKTGHADHSTVKKQHVKALKLSKVRYFVLYSFRHTFLTRLAASGCDAWTLARIAGWSNIGMSMRYVHPSDDSVLKAMSQLQPAEPKATPALPQ